MYADRKLSVKEFKKLRIILILIIYVIFEFIIFL